MELIPTVQAVWIKTAFCHFQFKSDFGKSWLKNEEAVMSPSGSHHTSSAAFVLHVLQKGRKPGILLKTYFLFNQVVKIGSETWSCVYSTWWINEHVKIWFP